jgi:DNA polymerase III delta prime subunit
MIWLEKHKPKTFDEINIQLDIKKKMEDWLILFRNRQTTNNFLYLYGVPGSGKTTMANLLLKKYNYDILEWNVIDLKQNKNLDTTLEKVIKRKNINIMIKQKKVYSAVILEECDCLSNSGKELISKITDAFKTLEDVVPIICTSNELEEMNIDNVSNGFNNYKNSYNLYFGPLLKNDILITYQKIKKIEKWQFDFENEILTLMFEKLDTDLRQWLIHLENIVNIYKKCNKTLTINEFYKYWNVIEKKNKNYTNYQIVEKLLNKELTNDDIYLLSTSDIDITIPMMAYVNVENCELNINEFLKQRIYISNSFMNYEIMRNYKSLDTSYDIQDDLTIHANYYSLSSINYINIKNVNKCKNIVFPSIIYNKKYTECTHRKMITTLMLKYNVSFDYIKNWSYSLYFLNYIDKLNDYEVIEVLNNYNDIFGQVIDIDDISEIFKCDFLRYIDDDIIKKRKKENILKNILNILNIEIVKSDIKKPRGRPSKKKLK